MNCLHYLKENPKISNFLQFESEIRSKAFPASILISLIYMIDSQGENTDITQKTPSKIYFHISPGFVSPRKQSLYLAQALLRVKPYLIPTHPPSVQAEFEASYISFQIGMGTCTSFCLLSQTNIVLLKHQLTACYGFHLNMH